MCFPFFSLGTNGHINGYKPKTDYLLINLGMTVFEREREIWILLQTGNL